MAMTKQIPEMSDAELRDSDKTLSAIITVMLFLALLAVVVLVQRTVRSGFGDGLPAVAALVAILGGSMPSFTRRAAVRAELGKRAGR